MATDPRTLNELFNSAVERYRDDEFLRFKSSGEWRSLTYGEVARRVRELAMGLVELGIEAGDRVAIWCENRPEWNLADLAALAIGAVDVPIYTTQALSQVEYIISDSRARAIFVSGPFLEKALSLKERVPTLEHVILFDENSAAVEAGLALPAEEISTRGRALFGQRPELYEKLWRGVSEEDLATLLYTSGTTGEPKGVMLTHKNLTANALNSTRWLELHKRRETALTYLPFTHVFERAVWYIYAYNGTKIAYAESIEAVAQNLKEVRPTVMTSVPRMFEKIYARILERGLGAGFPKRQLFLWSLDVGRRWAEMKDRGLEPGRGAFIKAKDRGQAGLQQMARGRRRQRPHLYIRRSAARPGTRLPVRRGRAQDSARIRTDGDEPFGLVQHRGSEPRGDRRPGDG